MPAEIGVVLMLGLIMVIVNAGRAIAKRKQA
jgi:hypothetical protein